MPSSYLKVCKITSRLSRIKFQTFTSRINCWSYVQVTTECFPTRSEFMRHKKTLSVLLIHILQRWKKSIPDSLRISRERKLGPESVGSSNRLWTPQCDSDENHSRRQDKNGRDVRRPCRLRRGFTAFDDASPSHGSRPLRDYPALQILSPGQKMQSLGCGCTCSIQYSAQEAGSLCVLGTHCTARQTKTAAHTWF